ncbi:hypothetical protein K469DRAFT_687033 [Zopfia rhizophila CBS 207.26]|uniref:Uncharacterized protein n=1 Tax=Zopfia rhizophila CBS 207.26 TaxID=1314779 RepID=A0A6A6E7C1_9PEZI|nr:hypothetical protein K469DRAFT_687033 [Zopfia rhizophila CBS 207.26]
MMVFSKDSHSPSGVQYTQYSTLYKEAKDAGPARRAARPQIGSNTAAYFHLYKENNDADLVDREVETVKEKQGTPIEFHDASYSTLYKDAEDAGLARRDAEWAKAGLRIESDYPRGWMLLEAGRRKVDNVHTPYMENQENVVGRFEVPQIHSLTA